MTNIIVESTLFLPVRDWAKNFNEYLYDLLTCHQCCGFWCGLFCGGIIVSYNPLWILTAGFAGSFISSFFVTLNEFLLSKIDFDLGGEVDE